MFRALVQTTTKNHLPLISHLVESFNCTLCDSLQNVTAEYNQSMFYSLSTIIVNHDCHIYILHTAFSECNTLGGILFEME